MSKNRSKILRGEFLQWVYSISLVIGIVIGTGIFFKNKSMFAASQGNSAYVIAAWVIGGVITLCSAIAFSILSRKTKKSDAGIAEFSRYALGNRFGHNIKLALTFIYYPAYMIVVVVFTTKFIFQMFDVDPSSMTWQYLLAVLGLFIFVISVTFGAKTISKYFQISSTVIKLIPFLFMVIIAFAAIFMLNKNAMWNKSDAEIKQIIAADPSMSDLAHQTNGMNGASIIFWMIPSSKFAYDGFLGITNEKRNLGEKKVSIALIIGVGIVFILYVLTAVAVLSQGTVDIPSAITHFMNISGDSEIAVKKVILFIIIISGLGSAFGFATMWNRSIEQLVDDIEHKKKRKGVFMFFAGGFIILILPMFIGTLVLANKNVGPDLIDTLSDLVILFAFSIKGIVLSVLIYKVFRKKVQLNIWFTIFAFIATLGILITVGYKLIDAGIINLIKHPFDEVIVGYNRIEYSITIAIVFASFFLVPYVFNKLKPEYLKNSLKNQALK